MKKNVLKIALSSLSLGLLLAGCGNPASKDSSSSQEPEVFTPTQYESNGIALNQYQIVIPTSANATVNYAASELCSYIKKATGVELKVVKDDAPEGEYEILLGECTRQETKNIDFESLGEESYAIQTLGKDLLIEANPQRGMLYGVYSFLEALGFRYYTPNVEKIPSAEQVFVPAEMNLSWTPVFDYRETMFKNAWDPSFAVKSKINSDFQRPELKNNLKYGGFSGYIGGARYLVHTFKYLLPYDTYFSLHPTWYAQNVGPTYTGAEYRQPCFTNFESIDVVYAEAERLIESDPTSNILSISQNDGGDFCKCETCQKQKEQYGESGVMLRYINELAKRIGEKYPHVKIDTLAYAWSIEPPKEVVAEKNVTVRFCTEMCPFHDDSDDCEILKQREQYFIDWQNHASELSVWTYPISFVNYFNAWPNYYELKANTAFYAKHGVKSIYQEGFHRDSCEFAELKAYLLSKLDANPFMSDEEYEYHLLDFLEGYYGEGYKHIRNYIQYAHDAIKANIAESGCLSTSAGPEDLFDFDYDGSTYDMKFIQKMNQCWDKALDLADDVSYKRVEKSSLHWTYVELYNTFDNRYLNGTVDEMEELEERNRNLYSKMKEYGTIYRYNEKTINMAVTDFKSSPATW